MRCDKFKCIYDVDGECDQDGGECIGDMCERARNRTKTSATG